MDTTPVLPPSPSRRCVECGVTLNSTTPDGLCLACLLEVGLHNASPDIPDTTAAGEASPAEPVHTFGDFELMEEIARGGMGVVYKARQGSLNRIVALKMILSGQFAGEAEVQRFRREAEAAAHLKHPNIVAIHEVGERDGHHYFSMDYVEGCTLRQLTRDNLLPAARATAYLKTIAEAVHYAHQQGVVHRDLKPSNVLIDAAGQPHVTDFGLAKRIGSTADLTVSGAAMGTPGYMPPEQASGQTKTASPFADVYALGAMLYDLLTGRPPHRAETPLETMAQTVNEDPVAPRLLNPAIPRDLETIALKCLEKEPNRRYATAQALADELGRFLRDEPIHARPVGASERLWRWCRRHPAVASLATVSAVLVLIVAVVSTVAAVRLRLANQATREQLRESLLAQARAGRQSIWAGHRFDSLSAIARARQIRDSPEMRDEVLACLPLADFRAVQTFDLREGETCVELDPERNRYLLTDATQRLQLVSLGDRENALSLPDPGLAVAKAAFSRSGRWLGVNGSHEGSDMHLVLYDLSSGQIARRLTNGCIAWDVSPDEKLLAVAHERGYTKQGTVVTYDLVTGKVQTSVECRERASAVRFSPDGGRLAYGGSVGRNVTILDTSSAKVMHELVHSNANVFMAWRPDGKALVVSCGDHHAYLWNLTQNPPSAALFFQGGLLRDVFFSEDGKQMVTCGIAQLLRVWDLNRGRELMTMPAHRLGGIAPHGRWLGQPNPRQISWFEYADGRIYEDLVVKIAGVGGGGSGNCAFAPDGRLLISGHADGVRFWDLHTGRLLNYAAIDVKIGLLLDPLGRWLLTGDRRAAVRWRLQQDAVGSSYALRLEERMTHRQYTAAMETDGTGKCYVISNLGRCSVVEWNSGRTLQSWLVAPYGIILQMALSPDARWFAATPGERNEFVNVWDVSTSNLVQRLPVKDVTGFLFSLDNRWLITVSAGELGGWDTATWSHRWRLAPKSTPTRIGKPVLTSDSRLGIVAVADPAVRLLFFDVATGKEIGALQSPDDLRALSLAISPDGSQLAASGGGPLIRVWNLRRIRRELADLGLNWDAPRLNSPGFPADIKPLNVRIEGESENESGADSPAQLEERLKGLQAQPGVNHSNLLALTLRLAMAYRATNRLDDARILLEDMVRTQRKTLPSQSSRLADPLMALAEIQLAQGRYTNAESSLRECVGILKQSQPGLSPTFRAQSLLGAVLIEQKKYADAEPLLKQAYEGLKKRDAERPVPSRAASIKETAERLLRLYEAWEKPDQAGEWREKLR